MRKMCLAFALIMVAGLGGCISNSSNVSYGDKGPAVGCSTLKQIKPGQTTKEWLLTVLGEPSKQSKTSEDREILKYEYVKKTKGDFSAPFVNLHDNKEQRTTLCFEIQDDIVKNYWKEQ